jgi:hypothetical protein
MIIERSIDIENEVRKAFGEMLVCYCRPLPKDFETPCVLVQQVGGSDLNRIDTFEVVLDARARSEAQALLTLRTAVGILREVARQQTTEIRHVTVNSSGSWGNDPVRPDLAMCSARLSIVAHPENVEVDENDS